MPNQKHTTLALRLNLALVFVESLMVLGFYLARPSEPGSAAFLGFSYSRLTLILLVLFSSLGIGFLLFSSFKNSRQTELTEKFFTRLPNQKWFFWIYMLWITIAYSSLFLSGQQLGALAAYREQLLPILLWSAALAIQVGSIVLYLRGINPEIVRNQWSLLQLASAVLILFGLLLLLIKLTDIGLTPDPVYWQEPGVPILLSQVFLATFAGVVSFTFIERTKLGKSHRLDLVVFLGLWGIACLIWLNQPAKLTYFSIEPREPNFQSYPFSDALVYDSTAQEFLIGKPIPSDLWVKPIYALFLALLHLFSGNDYTLLALLQTTILAVIPSLIYVLTTLLDKRTAGLVAALLIIIRERNAMVLSNIIQVSHSKLLLSDVFSMGEMVLLVLLAVWWLQRPGERRAAPVAIGGMLGLLILTRGHTVLMIPVIFLVGFLLLKPNLRLWYESLWRMTLGLSLVLLPWFLHTYQLTGKFAFQDPTSPYAARDAFVDLYAQSSASDTTPNRADPSSYEEFQSQAFKILIEHPGEVAYFTSAHYFHNLIFSYIYLPGSFQIEDLRVYVKRQPFWSAWDGFLPTETWIIMLLNFAALALGIAVVWKKVNKLIFIPVILGAAYNLSIAVTRRSGWRFILPADWITVVFYAIGLVHFVIIIQALGQQNVERSDTSNALRPQPSSSAFHERSSVILGLPFFLISLGLVFGHNLFPLRYPAKSTEELLSNYQSALRTTSGTESASLKKLVQSNDALIVQGRALYPVYLKANEGMLNYKWPSFAPKPYNRLAFYLIGAQSLDVNLPMESPPGRFPAGSDVIVIGCLAESGEINALSVLIQGSSPTHYSSKPFPTPVCPFSGTTSP